MQVLHYVRRAPEDLANTKKLVLLWASLPHKVQITLILTQKSKCINIIFKATLDFWKPVELLTGSVHEWGKMKQNPVF